MTALQFEQDGDVVTADSDGFITIYSVDSDGAYFVRMEFEVKLQHLSLNTGPSGSTRHTGVKNLGVTWTWVDYLLVNSTICFDILCNVL